MSSSAEREALGARPLDWDDFTERSVPEPEPGGHPASEVAKVLQHYESVLRTERGRTRTATDHALETAVGQAVLVAKLGSALERHEKSLAEAGLTRVHRELRILRDQMLSALAEGGVTLQDPTGQAADEVIDRVDVIGWEQAKEYTAPVVARTQEAVVLHRGSVVRPGRVVMGSPPDAEEAEDGGSTGDTEDVEDGGSTGNTENAEDKDTEQEGEE